MVESGVIDDRSDPHLVADLFGLLGQRVVLVLRLPDVLLVSQSLHVLQLLVRQLQLLLVVVVLLHFGLKVTQLLLGGEHRARIQAQPQLHAQLHRWMEGSTGGGA